MNDLSDESIEKLVGLVRGVVKEELNVELNPVKVDIQQLKVDVSVIKQDVQTVKHTLGNHSIMLGSLRADVNGLKAHGRAQSRELHKLGVLFEDLDDRFAAASELSK